MTTVIITFDPALEEYCVRAQGAPLSHGYYTPDKEDAEATARREHGADCVIKHRRRKPD